MKFPGEELVTTAIETLSAGLIKKMDEAEARRDREFTLKMKELEFYKSNYDKELRDIFDFWFDIVRIIHIKDNEHLTEQERQKHQKKYAEYVNVDKIARYKMNTLKYGGRETGRIFALQNKLQQSRYKGRPKYSEFYIWCVILSVLKREILGQDIDPLDIIQVLVNDFDDNEEELTEAKQYICNAYKSAFGSTPFWAYTE